VEAHNTSPIEGAERWSYGAFAQDHDNDSITIPLLRDDGESTEFTVPKFVSDPHDIRSIAIVVIGAVEKWESVQGLGA
jgi:hypothetical protein